MSASGNRSRELLSLVVALVVSSYLTTSVQGFTLTAPKIPRVTTTSSRNYDVTGIDHSIHGSGSALLSPPNKQPQAILSVSTPQSISQSSSFSNPLQTTLSATKGIVVTTVYTSTSVATGSVVRNAVKLFLSIFPTWMRLFVQPFLILYFVPLFILRTWTGANRKRAKAEHEQFVARFRTSMNTADGSKEQYWPAHA